MVTAVAAILALVVALLVGYALWTAYDNTVTPTALAQAPAMNMTPSPRGTLSPTAARALKAYGGEAVWNAVAVDSTATVGASCFS